MSGWMRRTTRCESTGVWSSQATAVAVGVTADGERHVLDIDAGASEDGAFWTAFLRSLVRRGRQGVCAW